MKRAGQKRRAVATPAAPEGTARKLPRSALALIFAVAFAVRVSVAEELGKTVLYQLPQLDALEFLSWAQELAAGNWGFPQYPTHGVVYPAFLAGLLTLFDGSLRAVRWAQAAVGGLTCVLAALVAQRFWGRRAAALAAGLLLALHGPLVFEDTALWEEVLLLPLLMASLLVSLGERRRSLRTAGAGLCLGLAVALRPTSLVLLPVLLFWWGRRGGWRSAAVLLAAAAMIVVPAVALASWASGTFLFVRGFGAVNLWLGNDPAGGGAQNARVGGAWDTIEALPAREGIRGVAGIEDYFLRRTLRRAAADPAGLVKVVLSKAAWLVQSEEIRDNHSFYFFRAQSRLLELLPTFGLMLGLALCGLWTAWRRRAVPFLGVAYLLALAVPPLVALVGLRYRMPIVPMLAVFAGLGVDAGIAAARRGAQPGSRRFSELLSLGAIFLLGLGVAQLRRHPPSHDFAEEWTMTGTALDAAGRSAEAEAAFRRALEADPRAGVAWDGLGRLRYRVGRLEEARQMLVRAVALDPDFRRAHYHLALVYRDSADPEAALREFRAALELSPRYPLALEAMAPLLVERGRLAEGAAAYRSLVEIEPQHFEALTGLARIAGAQRRFAEGIEWAERAVAAQPGRPEGWLVLGFLAVEAGDAATARTALERLEELTRGEFPELLLLRARVERLAGGGPPN